MKTKEKKKKKKKKKKKNETLVLLHLDVARIHSYSSSSPYIMLTVVYCHAPRGG